MVRFRILIDHGFGFLQFRQQEFVFHDHILYIAIGLEISLLALLLNPVTLERLDCILEALQDIRKRP
jgi:hypothetical protein